MMHRNRVGFSMLEMTITTMIIGIICVAAIPKLQASIEGRNIEAASRQFIAELQYCRSLAIRENRRIRVQPTISSFSYQLRRYTSSGSVLSTETINLSTTAQTPTIIEAFAAPPNNYLEINHRGEINAPSGDTSGLISGSVASIRFRSGSKTKTIQISPAFVQLP